MVAYTVTSKSEEEVMVPAQGSPSAPGFCLSTGCHGSHCSQGLVWDQPFNRIKEQWLVPRNQSSYPAPDPEVWDQQKLDTSLCTRDLGNASCSLLADLRDKQHPHLTSNCSVFSVFIHRLPGCS